MDNEDTKRKALILLLGCAVICIQINRKRLREEEEILDWRKAPRLILGRSPNIIRDREKGEHDLLSSYSQEYFRLPRISFNRIVSSLRYVLTSNPRICKETGQHLELSPELKLMITLRFLAGSSYADLEKIFYVAISTIFNCVIEVVKAIVQEKSFDFIFPQTEKDLISIESGFASRSKGSFFGCIGAIDGFHVNIKAPVCSKPVSYIDKDGNYSILSIVACDHSGMITYASTNHVGSVHDSAAFKQTSLIHHLTNLQKADIKIKKGEQNEVAPYLIEQVRLMSHRFFLADAAFPLLNYLLKPYPLARARKGTAEDCYNYQSSRCRIEVERVFGTY
jgi:hypothetical protein